MLLVNAVHALVALTVLSFPIALLDGTLPFVAGFRPQADGLLIDAATLATIAPPPSIFEHAVDSQTNSA